MKVKTDSESKMSRVLPLAFCGAIAASFVACGHKNGARELITAAKKAQTLNKNEKSVADPQLKQQIQAASATVQPSESGQSFQVTVRLLVVKDAGHPFKVVATGKVPVGNLGEPEATPTPQPSAKVDGVLNGQQVATPQPGLAAKDSGLLQLSEQESSPEVTANSGIGIRASCLDANCSRLSVRYYENTPQQTGSAVNGKAAPGKAAATPGVLVHYINMIFGGATAFGQVMKLEACGADPKLVCGQPSFEEATGQAPAGAANPSNGSTPPPQQQPAPNPGQTTSPSPAGAVTGQQHPEAAIDQTQSAPNGQPGQSDQAQGQPPPAGQQPGQTDVSNGAVSDVAP